MLSWVVDSRKDFIGIVTLNECASGANSSALAAGNASDFREIAVEGATDMGSKTTVVRTDNSGILIVFADRYATAAQDALRIISNKVRSRSLNFRLQIAAETDMLQAKVFSQFLQLAVLASRAGQALLAVIGKNQLQGHFA